MPESKNTNDTADETVEPTDATPGTADVTAAGLTGDPGTGVADDAAAGTADDPAAEAGEVEGPDDAGADAGEVQDDVEGDGETGGVRVVEGVEVADDLVDVPEELTEDVDEDDTSDDEDDEDPEADSDDEDEDADAGDAVVAGAAAGAAAKAGKDVATKAKKDGKPGKTVKPPKVKKAEKAKKKAGPPPRKMPKQRRWVAPLMLACWLIGLAWLVVFYVAGSDIPYMKDLNNWNLLIGMALIALGFVVSTQWV